MALRIRKIPREHRGEVNPKTHIVELDGKEIGYFSSYRMNDIQDVDVVELYPQYQYRGYQ